MNENEGSTARGLDRDDAPDPRLSRLVHISTPYWCRESRR